MKRIIPNANLPVAPPKVPDIAISEINIEGLISDSLLVLYREIKNLMFASAKGKLDPASARDLRDHLKLLFELKDREKNKLDSLTDEELNAIAAKVLAAQEP